MAESIKELRKICQETSTPMKSWSEKIQRKISIYFTKLLLPTGVTANQVSIFNILFGIVVGAFFAAGHPRYAVIGAILYHFWNTFDYVDGEIARYRKSASITGLYIDRLNHIIVEPYIFVCLSFGLFKNFHAITIFIFGFSAALSRLLSTLVVANMHASVLETLLYSSKKEPLKENIPNSEQSGYVFDNRFLTTRSSLIYNTVWFMYLGLGKIWMLLVASILDVFVSIMNIGPFTFNSTYIFIIIFGVLSPFSWIGLAFLIVKRKSCENLYSSFFIKFARKL